MTKSKGRNRLTGEKNDHYICVSLPKGRWVKTFISEDQTWGSKIMSLWENKTDGKTNLSPTPSVLRAETWLWRDGCHDNKHLRRVLEKLMNLWVSPSFPIFQTHWNTPHPQINNSITAWTVCNYSTETLGDSIYLMPQFSWEGQRSFLLWCTTAWR